MTFKKFGQFKKKKFIFSFCALKDQKVPHGSTFESECIDNYEIVYQEEPPICQNGSWSYLPSCVPGELIH